MMRCSYIKSWTIHLLVLLLVLVVYTTPVVAQEKALQLIGQVGGSTQAAAVQGRYAYVGVGWRLVVLDVSDPSSLHEVGATAPFEEQVKDIAISGTLAYVATAGIGLQVVDISDPTHPVAVGAWDSPGYAEGIVISGSTAYLADGPYGLRIVDVSDPTHPAEMSFAYHLNYAFDVTVVGNYACIAAAGAGLLVVDVSDPENPVEIGSLDTPGYAYGVAASSTRAYVYVADGWEGLRTVNVTFPSRPVEVGSYETPGWAFGIAISGDHAYVADAFRGLRIIDISDPTHPDEVGNYEIPSGHAGSVTVVGDVAYVADRNSGLHLVDVSDPETIAQIGIYAPLGYACAVAVSGDQAYVAAATYGLRIVDVSDPTQPSEIGVYDTQGYAIGVDVVGDYAYVAVTCPDAGAGFHVVDVSDPTHPTRVEHLPQLEGCYRDICVAGGVAYIPNEWGLELIDISSPLNPVLTGYLRITGEERGATTGVDVVDHLAYMVGDRGFFIIDVSDKDLPVLVNEFWDPEWVKLSDIDVVGTVAYITHHGGDSLKIMDVSDPFNPVQIGSYTGPSLPWRVTADSNIAAVAFGSNGLHGIDVSDPATPRLAFSYDTPGYTTASVVAGECVYAADGPGGLVIFEISDRPNIATKASVSSPSFAESSWRNASPSYRSLLRHGERYSSGQSHGRSVEEHLHSMRRQHTDESSIKPFRLPGTWVVNSTADSGSGTLREAMENAVSGDIILFDPNVFPPQEPAVIALQSNLPGIHCGNLTIDASDAGVILDGGSEIEGGIWLASNGNVLRGLQIVRFSVDGVGIPGKASNNIIGGYRNIGRGPVGQGNLISGNGGVGILLSGRNNVIQGNLIGTDVSGLRPFHVYQDHDLCRQGIFVQGGSHNVIGGTSPGQGNLVSGNGGVGVDLHYATENLIVGNYIGTDINGTADLGNEDAGVNIDLGSFHNIVKGNVISGSNWGGVVINAWSSSYNTVAGNLIGTDVTGTRELGNRWTGVAVGCGGASFNLIGGTRPQDRNIISGNPTGIGLHGREAGNLILGNFIGLDVTGTKSIGNDEGIFIIDDSSHNFIGGVTTGERNVISGNDSTGILVTSSDRNSILGNYIGTDADGEFAVPNGRAGIDNEGNHMVIQGNLIAGNSMDGVSIGHSGDFSHLRANRIGVAADSISPLPNGGCGVWIGAPSNTVGGLYPGDGNIIAFNNGDGIHVWNYSGNKILHNSVYSNTGSGIHLGAGGNNMLAAPSITDALNNSVMGSACPGCMVEVFSDADDEGRIHEGSAIADSTGAFTFRSESPLTGPNITATVTDSEGNTSEFSIPLKLRESPPWDVDRDGIVSIFDLILVAVHYGAGVAVPSYPNPDVNDDGRVDMSDLIPVAEHLGETYW